MSWLVDFAYLNPIAFISACLGYFGFLWLLCAPHLEEIHETER